MFSHILYYRRAHDAMHSCDPAADLLVEQNAYLLWRHVRQRIPHDALVYGGVVVDRQNLSVIRFNHDLYFDGVEEWMKEVRRPYGNKKLGFHQDSRYRSILRPLYFRDRDHDLSERLKLINEFFEECHPVPGGHVPWRRGTLGNGNVTGEWIAIKECFIDSCLGVVPTAA